MTQPNSLKPCPFCGGEVTWLGDTLEESVSRDAYCPGCGCAFWWHGHDKEHARKMLNTRPAATDASALADALKCLRWAMKAIHWPDHHESKKALMQNTIDALTAKAAPQADSAGLDLKRILSTLEGAIVMADRHKDTLKCSCLSWLEYAKESAEQIRSALHATPATTQGREAELREALEWAIEEASHWQGTQRERTVHTDAMRRYLATPKPVEAPAPKDAQP